MGEQTENRFRAGIDRAISGDQLDRGIKLATANFGERLRNAGILRRQIVHGVTRQLAPAADPKAAEMAFAIEDHQGLGRRLSHTKTTTHIRVVYRKKPLLTRQNRRLQTAKATYQAGLKI